MDPAASQLLTYALFTAGGWAVRHFFPGLLGIAPALTPSPAPSPAAPVAPADFGARLLALEQAVGRLLQVVAAPTATK